VWRRCIPHPITHCRGLTLIPTPLLPENPSHLFPYSSRRICVSLLFNLCETAQKFTIFTWSKIFSTWVNVDCPGNIIGQCSSRIDMSKSLYFRLSKW
jgi:hypothetical protein